MRKLRCSLCGHLTLLLFFAAAMVGVWMLPVLLAGFPYVLSTMVLETQSFVDTGRIAQLSPLVILQFRALHAVLSWENVVGWTAVSTSTMALALLPLWWGVRRLFDARTAWCTVIIFSFIPLYWSDAISGNAYPLAYFFLFLGGALFAALHERHRVLAVALSALCFGATLASYHSFVAFLPWLLVAFVWGRRRDWRKGIAEAAGFSVVAYMAFVLPLLPNALHPDMNSAERIMVFVPVLEEHTTGIGHLYPDEYTYLFLQEEFQRRIVERDASLPFLSRQQERYVQIIFGVGDANIFKNIGNGLWLFANTFPQLLQQEYVGGAFLWLFIIPGAAQVFRRKRTLFAHIVGLWISMEFLLRFVLHYGRTHLMDIGWAIALFAGIGLITMCDQLHKEWKRVPATVLISFALALTVFQLGQANRQLFVHMYSRSAVPAIYAVAEAMNNLPPDAVVAHPDKHQLFYFADISRISIHPDTLDYLAGENKIAEPFRHYNVTHILGYAPEMEQKIRAALPRISVVSVPPPTVRVPYTPLVRYLLHMIR